MEMEKIVDGLEKSVGEMEMEMENVTLDVYLLAEVVIVDAKI
jgi:archaellum component FlaC